MHDISTNLHIYLVEGLLAVMLLNLILPIKLSNNLNRSVYWTRIGYFAFWMFVSTVIFSGIIAFVFTGRKLTISVDLMILVSIVLMFLDGYRAVKNNKLLLGGKDFRPFSSKVILLEIAIVAIVWAVAIWTK